MKEEYKITVVVPVYNAEKYLDRCVKSVVDQTYENWELILVDDGSIDSSYEICASSMKKDSRIIVMHQDNQGVSVARNKGIDHASGDILTFLDADDWLEANALETINTYWDEQLQLLMFDYYDAKDIENKQRRKFFSIDKLELDETFIKKNHLADMIFPGRTIQYQTCDPMIGAVWGKAYSCSYIRCESVRFPNGVFMHEDMAFNQFVVQNMTKARYISKTLYNYFVNDSSALFQHSKFHSKLIKNYENFCQYIKLADEMVRDGEQNNMYEKYVLWTMKVILWRSASEKDDKNRGLGRDYCMHFLKEISIKNQTLIDQLFIWFLRHKMIGFVEKMICLKKIFTHEYVRNV